MNSNDGSNLFNKDLFPQTPQKSQGWLVPAQQTQQSGSAQPGQLFSGTSFSSTPQAPFSQAPTSSSNPCGPFGSSFQQQSFTQPAPAWNSTVSAPPGSAWPAAGSSAAPGAIRTGQGSRLAPYSISRMREDTGTYSDVMDITAMKEYSDKSADEIRREDYSLGRKPNLSASGAFGSTGFLQTPSFPSSSSPFGQQSQLGQQPGVTQPLSQTATSSSFTSQFQNRPLFSPLQDKPSFLGSQASSPFGAGGAPPSNGIFGAGSANGGTATGGLPSIFNTNSQKSDNGMPFSANSTAQNSAFAPSSSAAATHQSPFSATGSLFAANNNRSTGTSPFSSSAFAPSSSAANTSASQPSTFCNPSPFSAAPSSAPPNLSSPFSNASLFSASHSPFATNTTSFSNSTFYQAPSYSSNGASNMTSYFSTAHSAAIASHSDPYLISGLYFDREEAQRPGVRTVLPQPLFDGSRQESRHKDEKFEIRPPRKVSAVSGLYTVPEIGGKRGAKIGEPINNLVIGFEGKGRIEYLEPVVVSSLEEIERKVKFVAERVEVSDPPGTGLNKRARVFVENVFPFCRLTGTQIRGRADKWPERGIQERFLYQLRNSAERKLVEYDPYTGLYVYEVNHF